MAYLLLPLLHLLPLNWDMNEEENPDSPWSIQFPAPIQIPVFLLTAQGR